MVHSFHGATLLEAIERGVNAAATAGTESPAVARARSAAARDAIEPLRAALRSLDDRAAAAVEGGAQSPEWDRWIEALRLAFAAADESQGHLARVLAEPPRGTERSLVPSSAVTFGASVVRWRRLVNPDTFPRQ